MGKRSEFERVEFDKYYTPLAAVIPLLAHLPKQFTFIEPCAGDGRLIRHVESLTGGKCTFACDIAPEGPEIAVMDVLFFGAELPKADLVITNPVWDRDPLHAMIEKFRNHADTWLLFDAGWAYTKQALTLIGYCHKIVTVGRINWIEGTKTSGMEDCAWFLFKNERNNGYAEFYPKK